MASLIPLISLLIFQLFFRHLLHKTMLHKRIKYLEAAANLADLRDVGAAAVVGTVLVVAVATVAAVAAAMVAALAAMARRRCGRD